MFLSRRLAAVALCAFAFFARAESLTLLAPADGVTLRGGSSAELRWDAAALPAFVEEWEAFLSVDGGEYYGFRVTPHLDIDRKHFTFTVPNVDTGDARILIRTGDEKRETGFEIPGSFSIVRDPEAEPAFAPLPHFEHGEAAREGDPEVLSWTDGERDGSGVKQESSAASLPPPSLKAIAAAKFEECADVTPEEDSLGSLTVTHARPAARVRLAVKAESIPVPVDLLLVCRRRNI